MIPDKTGTSIKVIVLIGLLCVASAVAGCTGSDSRTEIVLVTSNPTSSRDVDFRTSDGKDVTWKLNGKGWPFVSAETSVPMPPGDHKISIWSGGKMLDEMDVSVDFGLLVKFPSIDIPYMSQISLEVNDWREFGSVSNTSLTRNGETLNFDQLWNAGTQDYFQQEVAFGERSIQVPANKPGKNFFVLSTTYNGATVSKSFSVSVASYEEVVIDNNFVDIHVRVFIFPPGATLSADGCGVDVSIDSTARCLLDVQTGTGTFTYRAEWYGDSEDVGHDDPIDSDTLQVQYPPNLPVNVIITSGGTIDVYQ